MTGARERGSQFDKFPLRPALMARSCRKMAQDMRREHAMGWGPISIDGHHGHANGVPRDIAAASMERQAERWEAECRTGVPNIVDRVKIGAPT